MISIGLQVNCKGISQFYSQESNKMSSSFIKSNDCRKNTHVKNKLNRSFCHDSARWGAKNSLVTKTNSIFECRWLFAFHQNIQWDLLNCNVKLIGVEKKLTVNRWKGAPIKDIHIWSHFLSCFGIIDKMIGCQVKKNRFFFNPFAYLIIKKFKSSLAMHEID